MNILDQNIENKIHDEIIPAVLQGRYESADEGIAAALDELYTNIPDNKRISYGIVHTIKVLSECLFMHLGQAEAPVFEIAVNLFEKSRDGRCKGVALGILSFYGLGDYPKVLPYFETASASEDWNLREFAQMFFRRLIKKYPAEMKEFLLRLADSADALTRRFVGETLRPVQENGWFYNDPDYPLSVLRRMFNEPRPYPRTSVGNNLSDLARRLPELVYGLVAELVASGDKNSYWIAYRACRNLVKKTRSGSWTYWG
jgi:3-methyladenine DNA glycosylase AlkC